jgi:FkbM family methyltransferase
MRIEDANRVMLLPDSMESYRNDITTYFNHYWNAIDTHGETVIDFMSPALHTMRGFPFDVWLPSFTESMEELGRYVDHADLSTGGIVVDAGGYVGITSMLAADIVGPTGTVITLEPDGANYWCARSNFAHYRSLHGYGPSLLRVAVWDEPTIIRFTHDSAMGSAAAAFIGDRGIPGTAVASTLSDITAGLSTVDWLKLDVEGAEVRALSDEKFFTRHHPRVTVECHFVDGEQTIEEVAAILGGYGYRVDVREQAGSPFPLIEAT